MEQLLIMIVVQIYVDMFTHRELYLDDLNVYYLSTYFI